MFHCLQDELQSYSTSFRAGGGGAGGALSEGGHWINGSLTGIFQDMLATPGFCYGAGPSASPPYDDPTAVLDVKWGPVQSVELTVQVTAIEPGANQELEARLLTTISADGTIKGYEIMWSITTNTYIDMRRWDGGTDLPSFVQIGFLGSGTSPQLQTGYRLKATVDALGVFRAYTDSGSGYVLMLTSTADLTYRSGSPGLGAFKHAGDAGPLLGAGVTYFYATGRAA